MKITAFTVCTPEYTFEEVAKLFSELGMDAIEIRVGKRAETSEVGSEDEYGRRYWSHNVCSIDEDHILEHAKEAKQACDKYGIKILSLSSGLDVDNIEKIEQLCNAANEVGAKFVRVWSKWYNGTVNYNELLKIQIEKSKELEQFAIKYNVKILFEIHMEVITPSASAMYRFISNLNPQYFGVIFDPGNMTKEGYEQFKMGLEILDGYIDHIHVKNGKWHKGDKREDGTDNYYPEFCEIDEGHIDMRKFIKLTKEWGYDGYYSLEDFSNSRNTREKLEHYINFMGSCENE